MKLNKGLIALHGCIFKTKGLFKIRNMDKLKDLRNRFLASITAFSVVIGSPIILADEPAEETDETAEQPVTVEETSGGAAGNAAAGSAVGGISAGTIAAIAAIAAAERYLGNHKLIDNVSQKIVTAAIYQGNEIAVNYLWNNVKTVQNSPLCKDRFDDIVTEEQFREQLKAAREDQIHAKAFQAAMLAALVKASPKNRSLWLDWVINYAGSTLADSSVYLKAYMHEGQ